MICFEIKKIFSKTISRISLIVLLFSLVISCYFAITNITYIDNRGDQNPEYTDPAGSSCRQYGEC